MKSSFCFAAKSRVFRAQIANGRPSSFALRLQSVRSARDMETFVDTRGSGDRGRPTLRFFGGVMAISKVGNSS